MVVARGATGGRWCKLSIPSAQGVTDCLRTEAWDRTRKRGKSLKIELINATLVGVGGFLGALFRFALSGLIHQKVPATSFPFGTLSVNMIGCFLIGVLFGAVETRHLLNPAFRSLVVVGLLGGFTTYSAFGYETFAMVRNAEPIRAVANVGVHVVLGLLLVWAGYGLSARTIL